jgi:hypothetical protein
VLADLPPGGILGLFGGEFREQQFRKSRLAREDVGFKKREAEQVLVVAQGSLVLVEDMAFHRLDLVRDLAPGGLSIAPGGADLVVLAGGVFVFKRRCHNFSFQLVVVCLVKYSVKKI